MRGGGDKTRMGYVHHSGGFLHCVKPDWSTPGLLFDLPLDYTDTDAVSEGASEEMFGAG